MAKATLNSIFKDVSGQVGNLVFRRYKGRVIFGEKAVNDHEATAAQEAHRERFQDAVDYGKSALADPVLRARYEEVADDRGMPTFSVCVADFFNPPTIRSIDASAYTGKAGDAILIKARDDFGVTRVSVLLTDDDTGTLVGKGEAVETSPGSGRWVFTVTNSWPSGIPVKIQVTATDHPGGTGVMETVKRI